MANGAPHNGGGIWPPPRRGHIRRIGAFLFTVAAAIAAFYQHAPVAGGLATAAALLQLPDVFRGPERQA